MTIPTQETCAASFAASGAVSSSILNLSVGQLGADERAELVATILSNPQAAALTKLGLRLANPAHQTASFIISAAGSHNKGFWNARTLVTGACASLALLSIFSFSTVNVQPSEAGVVAMNQARGSDRFGAAGSFEGAVAANNRESLDRFASGGFEAD